MNNLEQIFTNIYVQNNWRMGQDESRSGFGSTKDYTKNIRNKLVEFIKDKSINSILDT
uniref:Uncharacterized protein n=1 Tax=viral metagenome TaxID=1070528 RepID=A0A6C0KPE1_9ZZZZ